MKVSIIIATYKASEYLRKAISSALAQSWQDVEIIVSDDAADPNVRQLAESFLDKRIRYRSNDQRLGPAGNHWAAFAEADGELISILNHDDLWKAGFLEKLCPVFDNPEIVVAFCDHDIIDEHGRIMENETNGNSARWGRASLSSGLHKPFAHLAARGTIPMAMGAVIRKSILPSIAGQDPGGAYDLFLSQQAASTGGFAYYVPKRLTAWRTHSTQLTSNPDAAWRNGTLLCFRLMMVHPAFAYCRKDVKRRLSDAEHGIGRDYLADKEYKNAITHASRALRLNPLRLRTCGVLAIAIAKQVMRSFQLGH